MDKLVTERTETFRYEMGELSGSVHPGAGDINLDVNGPGIGENGWIYLQPWHVAYLAKILPKVVKFYEEQGVDMSPPQNTEEDSD